MIWMSIIAIAIGLLACFWGYRLFRAWLAVAGLLLGAALGYYLGGRFFTGEMWPVIAAIALGIAFACLAYFLFKLGAVVIGAYLGALLFALLLAAFKVQPAWWAYVIGAVLGGLLAGCFLKTFIIIGSSFQGGYLAAVGLYSAISAKNYLFAQDWPMHHLSFPWYIYCGILLLTVIGAAVQFRQNKGRKM